MNHTNIFRCFLVGLMYVRVASIQYGDVEKRYLDSTYLETVALESKEDDVTKIAKNPQSFLITEKHDCLAQSGVLREEMESLTKWQSKKTQVYLRVISDMKIIERNLKQKVKIPDLEKIFDEKKKEKAFQDTNSKIQNCFRTIDMFRKNMGKIEHPLFTGELGNFEDNKEKTRLYDLAADSDEILGKKYFRIMNRVVDNIELVPKKDIKQFVNKITSLHYNRWSLRKQLDRIDDNKTLLTTLVSQKMLKKLTKFQKEIMIEYREIERGFNKKQSAEKQEAGWRTIDFLTLDIKAKYHELKRLLSFIDNKIFDMTQAFVSEREKFILKAQEQYGEGLAAVRTKLPDLQMEGQENYKKVNFTVKYPNKREAWNFLKARLKNIDNTNIKLRAFVNDLEILEGRFHDEHFRNNGIIKIKKIPGPFEKLVNYLRTSSGKVMFMALCIIGVSMVISIVFFCLNDSYDEKNNSDEEKDKKDNEKKDKDKKDKDKKDKDKKDKDKKDSDKKDKDKKDKNKQKGDSKGDSGGKDKNENKDKKKKKDALKSGGDNDNESEDDETSETSKLLKDSDAKESSETSLTTKDTDAEDTSESSMVTKDTDAEDTSESSMATKDTDAEETSMATKDTDAEETSMTTKDTDAEEISMASKDTDAEESSESSMATKDTDAEETSETSMTDKDSDAGELSETSITTKDSDFERALEASMINAEDISTTKDSDRKGLSKTKQIETSETNDLDTEDKSETSVPTNDSDVGTPSETYDSDKEDTSETSMLTNDSDTGETSETNDLFTEDTSETSSFTKDSDAGQTSDSSLLTKDSDTEKTSDMTVDSNVEGTLEASSLTNDSNPDETSEASSIIKDSDAGESSETSLLTKDSSPVTEASYIGSNSDKASKTLSATERKHLKSVSFSEETSPLNSESWNSSNENKSTSPEDETASNTTNNNFSSNEKSHNKQKSAILKRQCKYESPPTIQVVRDTVQQGKTNSPLKNYFSKKKSKKYPSQVISESDLSLLDTSKMWKRIKSTASRISPMKIVKYADGSSKVGHLKRSKSKSSSESTQYSHIGHHEQGISNDINAQKNSNNSVYGLKDQMKNSDFQKELLNNKLTKKLKTKRKMHERITVNVDKQMEKAQDKQLDELEQGKRFSGNVSEHESSKRFQSLLQFYEDKIDKTAIVPQGQPISVQSKQRNTDMFIPSVKNLEGAVLKNRFPSNKPCLPNTHVQYNQSSNNVYKQYDGNEQHIQSANTTSTSTLCYGHSPNVQQFNIINEIPSSKMPNLCPLSLNLQHSPNYQLHSTSTSSQRLRVAQIPHSQFSCSQSSSISFQSHNITNLSRERVLSSQRYLESMPKSLVPKK